MQSAFLSGSDIEDLRTPAKIALKLWTCAVKAGMGKELCSLLNEVIREDADDEIFKKSLRLARLMNTLVSDRSSISKTIWPEEGQTYRGSGLPQEEVDKFAEGYKYRASMFLATAFDEQVTRSFLRGVGKGMVPVLFIFRLHPTDKCDHVLYLEELSLIHGETEFLYAPYSVYTVLGVELPSDGRKPTWEDPVRIVLEVAVDNFLEPEDLPTQSWH